MNLLAAGLAPQALPAPFTLPSQGADDLAGVVAKAEYRKMGHAFDSILYILDEITRPPVRGLTWS